MPAIPDALMARPKIGLVLAGGAARGAYEVGVLDYMVEQVAAAIGRDVPIDILSGTSVGAVNAATLAAWADEPRARVGRLAAIWTGLSIREIVKPRATGALNALRGLLGRTVPVREAGGLIDSRPLERLLRDTVAFDRIDANLRAGHLEAVTASATQIATGRTVVFVQRRDGKQPLWTETPAVAPRHVRLRIRHALASAAVPLMFPAVRISGRYYCDGGLRQNVPLSPARRLGATSLIVVNPKHRQQIAQAVPSDLRREEAFPSPLFLVGKALNALLLDRVENEIDRLEKINAILDAGCRRFGPSFVSELNDELGYTPPKGLVRLGMVHIRSSQNIGELAADYVRQPSFEVRGVLGRLMKKLAEGEAAREADLLSYLLFDGPFAGQLIELGRHDARRHHDELCALFEAHHSARACG